MNKTSSFASFIGIAAVSLAGACTGSDVDQPTQEDYDQVAQALAPLVQQDVGAEGTIAVVNASARGQSIAAVSGSAGNLEWSLEVQCEDAAGVALEVCDARTDAAVVTGSVDGFIDLPRYDASLSASGHWTLDGLQSDEVTVTGDGQLVASSEFMAWWRDETRTFDLDIAKDYELTFPVGDPLGVRGEIHKSVDARRTRMNENVDIDKHFVIDVLVELAGDGVAIVTLDGNARYAIDLETGEVTPL